MLNGIERFFIEKIRVNPPISYKDVPNSNYKDQGIGFYNNGDTILNSYINSFTFICHATIQNTIFFPTELRHHFVTPLMTQSAIYFTYNLLHHNKLTSLFGIP